jgi:hypothetical protein
MRLLQPSLIFIFSTFFPSLSLNFKVFLKKKIFPLFCLKLSSYLVSLCGKKTAKQCSPRFLIRFNDEYMSSREDVVENRSFSFSCHFILTTSFDIICYHKYCPTCAYVLLLCCILCFYFLGFII